MRTYVSCNCHYCRNVPSGIKGYHKRLAHRTLRRRTKAAIRNDREIPSSISTGYKD